MNAESLPQQLSSVTGGSIYEFPRVEFRQTNLFLKIADLGHIFVKIPSERGMSDYRKYIRNEEIDPQDIRGLEVEEQFAQVEGSIHKYIPEIAPIMEVDREVAHYLLVWAMQNYRLKEQQCIEIPKMRLVALVKEQPPRVEKRFLRKPKYYPAVVKYYPAMIQEKIQGTSLWQMFDFQSETIEAKWRIHLPRIADRLRPVIESKLRNHIDWNIMNFVYQESSERLYYVDIKPTLLVARDLNNHNLKGIHEEFLS